MCRSWDAFHLGYPSATAAARARTRKASGRHLLVHRYWMCVDAAWIFATTFAGSGMYPVLSAIDWPVVTQ